MKFLEIQEYVNERIRYYCYVNQATPAAVARGLGIQKSRFSEIQKRTKEGVYVNSLSESVLSRLLLGGVVKLEEIRDNTEPTPAKKRWIELQEIYIAATRLYDRKYPVKEALEDIESQLDNTK